MAGADAKFALGLTVALFSAIRHIRTDRRADLFVLDGGLGATNRDRCQRVLKNLRPDVEITFIDDDPQRFAAYNPHWYSRAAYLRLLIPEVVPERYRRVLYIDSDVVVTDDIAELWDLPDEGVAFWAALDEGVRGTNYVEDTLGFANVPADAPYFNSGVMLIDLPRWKAARVSERAQALLAEHSDRCINVDQDALNAVALGQWSVLPPRWNFQIAGLNAWTPPLAPGARIGITHFINEKPWNTEVRCLRQSVFDNELRASGWYTPREYRRYRIGKRLQAIKMAPAAELARKFKRKITRVGRRLFAASPAS